MAHRSPELLGLDYREVRPGRSDAPPGRHSAQYAWPRRYRPPPPGHCAQELDRIVCQTLSDREDLGGRLMEYSSRSGGAEGARLAGSRNGGALPADADG